MPNIDLKNVPGTNVAAPKGEAVEASAIPGVTNTRVPIPPVDTEGSFNFQKGVEGVKESLSGLFGRIGRTTAGEAERATEIAADAREKFEGGEPIEGLAKTFVAGTKFLFAPVAGIFGGVAEPAVVDAFEALPQETQVKLAEGIETLREKHDQLPSEAQTALQVAGALFEIITTAEGSKAVTKVTQKALKEAGKAIGETIPKLKKSFTAVMKDVPEAVENLSKRTADLFEPQVVPDLEKAGKLIQSTNKIDPNKAIEFQAPTMSNGVPYGEWLAKRVTPGTSQEVTIQLIDRYNTARNIINATMENVKGSFNGKPVRNMLDELHTFYKPKEGVVLTAAHETKWKQVGEWLDIMEAGDGLTGKQMLDMKRLFERDVRINYLKENVGTNVQRANEIAAELRTYFTDELARRGFPEFKDINKEIQLSRFLADNIGRKLLKQSVREELGLIDNLDLMAAAIDPKALPALLAKKFIASDFARIIRTKFLTKGLQPEGVKVPLGVDTATPKLPSGVGVEPSPIIVPGEGVPGPGAMGPDELNRAIRDINQ